MRTRFLTIFLLFNNCIFAQSPQAISYQAVVRNTSGNPLASATVRVGFSIRANNATGTLLYQETHTGVPINQFGLFTREIESGKVNSGNFSCLNCGTGVKYLQVEFDPINESNFTNIGSSQILSVPYALYANKAIQLNLLHIQMVNISS